MPSFSAVLRALVVITGRPDTAGHAVRAALPGIAFPLESESSLAVDLFSRHVAARQMAVISMPGPSREQRHRCDSAQGAAIGRAGRANPVATLLVIGLAVLIVSAYWLMRDTTTPATTGRVDGDLMVYCAAGMRLPIERIAADYQKEYGQRLRLQYGGSNTLLNQIQVARMGDLFLAGDDSYMKLAHETGLIEEELPVARMRPVIAVAQGNPRAIQSVRDLLRPEVRVALGNADQAAIGTITRQVLQESGHWDALEKHVQENGVFKPTVSDVANDVKLGSVDAGIVWDSTAAQYPELQAISTPELSKGEALVTLGVVTHSRQPTSALRFARYAAARDRGLKVFEAFGFQPVDGDVWAEKPELTFFAGSVNRKALEPIVRQFAQREGVQINTVYNGCGILTAQMRGMLAQDQSSGFPDMYMACDVYYLDTVAELFQDAVQVSATDIVIVVQKGNPKRIEQLADLVRPGVRVALGQPEQCTIGVLSRRLLESESLYDTVLKQNVVTQTATSALLVPSVTTGSADAALAYATDTLAERDKLDIIHIDSPLAKAIQPYGIARSSEFKYLGRRLYQAISRSRDEFEAAGFVWRLGDPSEPGTSRETER